MEAKRLLTVVLAVLPAALVALPASAAASGCPGAEMRPGAADATPASYDAAIVCLINQQRATRHLQRLVSNAQLAGAATGHSQEMRSEGVLTHDSPNGEGYVERIRRTGYLNGARRWGVGENIGWGVGATGTPRALVRAWMKRSAHRANILGRRYRNIGTGAVWGSPSNAADQSAVTLTADFGFAKR